MLRYLKDPANAITACGLACSTLALYLTLAGRPELAVAMALWAMLADHLDGVVAARTPGRSSDTAKMGKSFDGFADIIYGAAVPAVVIIELSSASYLSLATAFALLLAGALRLSHFANFGLSSIRRFTGVPLSYDVPLLAIGMLARPWVAPDAFALMINTVFFVLSGLHVASIQVPALNGLMYAVVTAFSVAASGVLAFRGFSG